MGKGRRRRRRRIECTGPRVRSYEVFTRALETGIATGLRRAHKHTDAPTEEVVAEAVYNAVLSEVCDVFDFPEQIA